MPPPEEQLYDLMFDPNETSNLIGYPRHKSAEDEMRRRLETWMKETGDPLASGFVPAPEGARVNDADGISPREPVKEAT